MIQISSGTLIILCLTVFSYWGYLIYKEIRQAKGRERLKLVRQYVAIFGGGLILLAILKVFFQPQLTMAYEWLSSLGNPPLEIEPIPNGDILLPR